MYYYQFSLSFMANLSTSYVEDASDFITKFYVSSDSTFPEESTTTVTDFSTSFLYQSESLDLYFKADFVKGSKIYQIKIKNSSGSQIGSTIQASYSEYYPSSKITYTSSAASTDPDNPSVGTIFCDGRILLYSLCIDTNAPISGSYRYQLTWFSPRLQEKIRLKWIDIRSDRESGGSSSTTLTGYLWYGYSSIKTTPSDNATCEFSSGDEINADYENLTLYGVWRDVDVDTSIYDRTVIEGDTGSTGSLSIGIPSKIEFASESETVSESIIDGSRQTNIGWMDSSSSKDIVRDTGTHTITNTLAVFRYYASSAVISGKTYSAYWYYQQKIPYQGSKFNNQYYYMSAPGAYSKLSSGSLSLAGDSEFFIRTIRSSDYKRGTTTEDYTGYVIHKFPPNPDAPVDGCHFVGWSTSSSESTKKSNQVYIGYQCTGSSYTSFYGIWEADGSGNMTISFVSDYGTVPSSITTTKGSSVTIPLEHPTRTNYIFAGWGIKLANAGDASITDIYAAEYFCGYSYVFEEDATLHAVWTVPIPQNSTEESDSSVEQGVEMIDGTMSDWLKITGTIPRNGEVIASCNPYVYCVSLLNKFGYYDILNTTYNSIYIARHEIGTSGEVYYGTRSITGNILDNTISISEQSGLSYKTFQQKLSSVRWSSASVGNAYTNIRLGIDKDALSTNHYEFLGWFTGKSEMNWVYGNMTVSGGTLVTTQVIETTNRHTGWLTSPVDLTVICPIVRVKHLLCVFDAQGGTVDPTYKEYPYNGTFSDLPTPIYGTTEFVGWFTSVSGGTQIYDGSDPEHPTPTNIADVATEDFTIYAHWGSVLEEIRVYFMPNGGVCSLEYKTVENGQPYGELPTPTKTDSTFLGWYTGYLDGSEVISTTVVSRSENHYLYARWQNPSYTITFDPNGGTVSPTSTEVESGKSYGAMPIPTYSGHSFSGWYTLLEGGIKVSESDIPLGSGTLYAHWTESATVSWGYVKRSIVFVTNGGMISIAYGEYKYTVGTVKRLPDSTQVTKPMSDFMGWYKNADFSGQPVTQTEKTDNTKLTFYAKWSDK